MVNCGDVQYMLPKSLLVSDCDTDVTVTLLSKIRLACPGAEIIITGGLNHKVAFDQPNGTLTFIADPRPAEFTINYEVLYENYLGQESTFKSSLHLVR